MSRMKSLPIDDCQDAELQQVFRHSMDAQGFVPNFLLTMQRVPAIAKAALQINEAVFAPDGKVDDGFKKLVAHMASQASGCQYCKAHTSVSATSLGIEEDKMRAIYEYSSSPLFNERERIALDFALAAASVPNGVTDEMYQQLSHHWNDEEIVEILGVISVFGFFNRWNDSMATTLEAEPSAIAEKLIGNKG